MAEVRAWSQGGVLYEAYRYAPGPAHQSERHAHGDHQFCLSLNFPGLYRTPGQTFDVPAGSVSAIPAGLPHASGDPFDRDVESRYLMLYLSPERAEALGGGGPWRERTSLDPDLARALARAHRASDEGRLEGEEAVAGFLRRAALGLGAERIPRLAPHDSGALNRARSLLRDDPAPDRSLTELAAEVGLEPAYLCRGFARRFGTPPAAFRRAVRLDWARRELLRQVPVGEVALRCGFADGSHLARHFGRAFGVSPATYAKGQFRTERNRE